MVGLPRSVVIGRGLLSRSLAAFEEMLPLSAHPGPNPACSRIPTWVLFDGTQMFVQKGWKHASVEKDLMKCTWWTVSLILHQTLITSEYKQKPSCFFYSVITEGWIKPECAEGKVCYDCACSAPGADLNRHEVTAKFFSYAVLYVFSLNTCSAIGAREPGPRSKELLGSKKYGLKCQIKIHIGKVSLMANFSYP